MVLPRRSEVHRRRWFADARGDGRAMEFSWHPDKRLVIVSLWTGSTCRATFQLPIEEVPAVIGGLAESLGEAASAGTAPVEAGRLASFAERVRVRFRREPAQVLRLVKREARRPSR